VKKLHNELNDLYSSQNFVRVIKSKRIRWARHVAHMERLEVYTGFWWGKRHLGRFRQRWDDDIKMDLQELGCGGVEWIDLA
jgi:hypothetical protein